MEGTQVPIRTQVNKEEIVHIYKGILLSHRKNKIWLDVQQHAWT